MKSLANGAIANGGPGAAAGGDGEFANCAAISQISSGLGPSGGMFSTSVGETDRGSDSVAGDESSNCVNAQPMSSKTAFGRLEGGTAGTDFETAGTNGGGGGDPSELRESNGSFPRSKKVESCIGDAAGSGSNAATASTVKADTGRSGGVASGHMINSPSPRETSEGFPGSAVVTGGSELAVTSDVFADAGGSVASPPD
jgi:hypothetical protein